MQTVSPLNYRKCNMQEAECREACQEKAQKTIIRIYSRACSLYPSTLIDKSGQILERVKPRDGFMQLTLAADGSGGVEVSQLFLYIL